MGSFLTLDRRHVLCATETEAIFADVVFGKRGQSRVEALSHQDKKHETDLDAAALIAGTGRKKAKVALVLPLKEFQLVAVTAPPVEREAVAKVLPYSLAKVLDTSVNEHIYDWQVTQKFKDRHELTVYLYSAVKFLQYRNALEARKKEIAWFEPDVFAACSYLHHNRPGAEATAFLCLLVWPRCLSIAVYENQRITLTRSVDMTMPDGKPAVQTATDEAKKVTLETSDGALLEKNKAVETKTTKNALVEDFWLEDGVMPEKAVAGPQPAPVKDPLYSEDRNTLDLLAGFGLQADDPVEAADTPMPAAAGSDLHIEEPAYKVDPWQVYLESLNLEILRTGDYHVSVLKGSPVKEVFIGGAEHFHDALASIVQAGQNVQMIRFPPEEIEAKCSQTVAAICIGALQR